MTEPRVIELPPAAYHELRVALHRAHLDRLIGEDGAIDFGRVVIRRRRPPMLDDARAGEESAEAAR